MGRVWEVGTQRLNSLRDNNSKITKVKPSEPMGGIGCEKWGPIGLGPLDPGGAVRWAGWGASESSGPNGSQDERIQNSPGLWAC